MTTTETYFRSFLTLHTQSSLHAGVLGGNHIINRPIHRDVHSNHPKISSNALKGAIKEQWGIKESGKLFGTSDYELGAGKRPQAGLISFTDARLLFLPVHSKSGVWAWVTCPEVLEKLFQEALLAGQAINKLPEFSSIADGKCIYGGNILKVGEDSLVLYSHKLTIDKSNTELLEEGFFSALNKLLAIGDSQERLVIVSKENFKAFTALYTETITHNKIDDETKAVRDGALFTEEYLPANAVLYAMAFSMPNATQTAIQGMITQPYSKTIQLGGNATIGKGVCKLNWQFPNH